MMAIGRRLARSLGAATPSRSPYAHPLGRAVGPVSIEGEGFSVGEAEGDSLAMSELLADGEGLDPGELRPGASEISRPVPTTATMAIAPIATTRILWPVQMLSIRSITT
jgi:hypothetical protein